jgi:hypothetical protein
VYLASGGDDQDVNVLTLRLRAGDPPQGSCDAAASEGLAGSLCVMSATRMTRTRAHASAVKALALLGSTLFSAGYDQRLQAWQLDLQSMRDEAAQQQGQGPRQGAPRAVAWSARLVCSRLVEVAATSGV